MELYTDVARQYADFARYAGDSPCFEEWAEAVVDDPGGAGLDRRRCRRSSSSPTWCSPRRAGTAYRPPVRTTACAPALLDDDGTIRATILERATQTNEVGRLATLVPGSRAARRRGPAAGAARGRRERRAVPLPRPLVLRLDAPTTASSRPGSGPRLTCAVTGPAAAARPTPPAVAWRGGIDLHPLDVTDADAMAWLETLVWPEHDERRDRLRTAVAVARTDPPRLVAGDLLDVLPDLVGEAAAYGPVVVFHSAVIAYLEPPDRARFQQLMTTLVGARRLPLGQQRGTPGAARGHRDRARAPRGPPPAFVLGVDGRAAAWTHGHGASMQVL